MPASLQLEQNETVKGMLFNPVHLLRKDKVFCFFMWRERTEKGVNAFCLCYTCVYDVEVLQLISGLLIMFMLVSGAHEQTSSMTLTTHESAVLKVWSWGPRDPFRKSSRSLLFQLNVSVRLDFLCLHHPEQHIEEIECRSRDRNPGFSYKVRHQSCKKCKTVPLFSLIFFLKILFFH